MRFLQIVASNLGFRVLAGNAARWAMLKLLLEKAVQQAARLLVLPGGFLTTHDRNDMLRFVKKIGRHGNEIGVAVIGGIDIEGPETKRTKSEDAVIQKGLLPYYGFAVGPLTVRQPKAHPWRQTSTTNRNAWLVAQENIPGAERLVVVDDVEVAVIICGEIHSKLTRTSIGALGAALVIDLGHNGMGNGLIPAMTRVALNGKCAVAHAQHVGATTASIHFVNAKGVQHSKLVTTNELIWQGNLWAGWVARDLKKSWRRNPVKGHEPG